MTRDCPQCELPFEVFGLGERFRKYCSTQCKWKAYYYRHRSKSRNRRIKSQQSNAQFIDSYKTACVDCGNPDKRCLDFHHLRDKVMSVAALRVAGHRKSKILEEIKKCEVLCANCHRIRHWEEEHELQ